MIEERNKFQKRIQVSPCNLNINQDSYTNTDLSANIDEHILNILQKEYPNYDIKKDRSGLFAVQKKHSTTTSNPNPVFLVSKNKSQSLTPQKKLKLISNKKYVRKAEKTYRTQMHGKEDALYFIASLIQSQERLFNKTPDIEVKNTSRVKSLHSFLNKVGKYYTNNKNIIKHSSRNFSLENCCYKKPEKKLNHPQRFKQKNIKIFNSVFPRDIIGVKLFFCPKENIEKKDEDKIETKSAVQACYDACNLIEQTIDSNDKLFLLKKKDMIHHPKKNGYKAIHLIMRYENTFFEIQLKTEKMNIDSELDPNISHKTSYKPEEGAFTSRAVQRTPTYVEYPEINGVKTPKLLDRETSFKRFHGISISSFKKSQSEISKIRKRTHQLYRHFRPIYSQVAQNKEKDNTR